MERTESVVLSVYACACAHVRVCPVYVANEARVRRLGLRLAFWRTALIGPDFH